MHANMTNRKPRGFTLIETLVAIGVFSILALGVYGGFSSVFKLSSASNLRAEATAIANEQIEIARNLPYSDVGLIDGLPAGKLPRELTLTRDGVIWRRVFTIRNIDDPFDGQIGSSTQNDLSPADYRLVEVAVYCDTCVNYQPVILTTTIGPKNLENSSTNGALFVKVFDANGQPVAGATVHVTNSSVLTPIDITDTTNTKGELQLVDIPPGNLAYKITVAKSDYSSDQNYPAGGSAPSYFLNQNSNFSGVEPQGESVVINPLSPLATVLPGQLTSISFTIDKLATVNWTLIDKNCQAVDDQFLIYGRSAKKVATDPDVYKLDINGYINSGSVSSAIEWGTYDLSPADPNLTIMATLPLLPVPISPNSQNFVGLMLAPRNGQGLLVQIKDSVTGLPLSDVEVRLSSDNNDDQILMTSRGFLTQTDWSGGGGQDQFVDTTRFADSDGNIETTDPAGELKLKKPWLYLSSGWLISSVFDLGDSSSTLFELNWSPKDQPVGTGSNAVRFQIASSNDPNDETWNFVGTDDTAETYYDATNKEVIMSGSHQGHRYVRYKLFLHSDSAVFTPDISDISLTYLSGCSPSGQVFFDNLSSGVYQLTVSRAGYQNYSGEVNIHDNWQTISLTLTPS